MQITVNGRQAFVYTAEREIVPDQPTLLFVHGAGMEANVWALQARHFAFNGWNVVAVTRPGHGVEGTASYSEGPKNETVEQEADWLIAILDALGIDKVTPVGHSLGNLICLDFAGRFPERVEKLIMIATAAAIPVHPILLEKSGEDDDLADQLIASWGYGVKGHQGGNRTPGAWMLGASLKLLYRQGTQVLHKDLMQCANYKGGEDAAANVKAPTLIIAADGDKMTPLKAGKALAGMIKDTKFVQFDNCGHMIMPEQPDRTLLEMKAFLCA